MKYSIGKTINGLKTVKVKFEHTNTRGFSIQTNGSCPETHRNGVCEATEHEVVDYVFNHGTNRQWFGIMGDKNINK